MSIMRSTIQLLTQSYIHIKIIATTCYKKTTSKTKNKSVLSNYNKNKI